MSENAYCIFQLPADQAAGEEAYQVFRKASDNNWVYTCSYSELQRVYATLGRTDVPSKASGEMFAMPFGH